MIFVLLTSIATIVRVHSAKEPSVLILNQANSTNPALKLTLSKVSADLEPLADFHFSPHYAVLWLSKLYVNGRLNARLV